MKRSLLDIAVMALALAACGQTAAPSTSDRMTRIPTGEFVSTPGVLVPDQSPLANTSWKLESFGAPGQPQPLVVNSEITITFQGVDHAARGSAGCNTYGGTYAVSDTTLSFSDLAYTEIACDTPGVMEQEQRFQQALRAVEGYRLAGDRLELVYEGGNVLRWVAAK